MNVNETKFVVFNHTILQNNPIIGYVGSPDIFLLYNADGIINSQKCIYDPTSPRTHVGYYLKPGTYYFGVFNIATDKGYMQLQTQELAIDDPVITAIPAQQAFVDTDFQSFQLTNTDNSGETFPKVYKYNITESFNNQISLIINNTDNAHIVNEKTSIHRMFYYNVSETTYYERTGFSGTLDMFDSSANGDKLIFAIPVTRFNMLDIALSVNATTNNFIWQYYRNDTNAWVDFTPTQDTTTNGGVTRLGQSGTVTWNPASFSNWHLRRVGNLLPDTDERYYWIAVRCNTATPAAIPQISSIQATYIRTISGEYNMHFTFKSPYDNMQTIQYASRLDQAITLTSTSHNQYTYTIPGNFLSQKKWCNYYLLGYLTGYVKSKCCINEKY
jgi:hypothetical protein